MSLQLSSDTLHSCGVFTFPSFTDDQSDIIEARLISGNRRVSIRRSITEVIILITNGKCTRGPLLFNLCCKFLLSSEVSKINSLLLYSDTKREQCPQLADPMNGLVDILLSEGSILPGSVATYSCDVGFSPVGGRFRVCANNLTWSGETSTCMPGKHTFTQQVNG